MSEPFANSDWCEWESYCLEMIEDRQLYWRDEETVRDMLKWIRENEYVTPPMQDQLRAIYARSQDKA